MRRAILDALESRYQAEIAEADATIQIYLTNSVGIGEHPQHLEEIDKLLQQIVDAKEKIKETKNTNGASPVSAKNLDPETHKNLQKSYAEFDKVAAALPQV